MKLTNLLPALLLVAAPASAKPTPEHVYVTASEAFFCEMNNKNIADSKKLELMEKYLSDVQTALLLKQNYSEARLKHFFKHLTLKALPAIQQWVAVQTALNTLMITKTLAALYRLSNQKNLAIG